MTQEYFSELVMHSLKYRLVFTQFLTFKVDVSSAKQQVKYELCIRGIYQVITSKLFVR